MVPAEALIISLFQVLDGRQLTNRIIGLSLTYLIFVLPFTIWTLRGFVSASRSNWRRLRVDGASRFGAFMRVTLPLVAPRASWPPGSSPSSSPGTSSSSPW